MGPRRLCATIKGNGEVMQKEIWMAELDPVKGNEQRGRRPVVIISGESMNKHYNVVIICPLSTSIKNYHGCPVLLPDKINNLKKTSQVISFQVRTIAKLRLKRKMGSTTNDVLEAVKHGVNTYLNY